VWYKEWNYGTFAEAPPIFSWAAITLGIGSHSSESIMYSLMVGLYIYFIIVYFFAISKYIPAVKLCSNKILQLLTGVAS